MTYKTQDDVWISLMCLQGAKYWSALATCIGRDDIAADERFTTHEALTKNSPAAQEILADAFATATTKEWRERLDSFPGPWTFVQDSLQVASDPQALANGYVQECTADNGTAFGLVAAPIQFNEEPPRPCRAPTFNEQGDAILESIGFDWDRIVDLKVRGVVA